MQLSYAQGSTDVPLLAETVGENLEHTTARFPDRDALIVRHQGIRCTYREFDEATDRLAKSLLRLGVEIGDRVGMWSPNNAEWVAVQYATAKIGAILVNVNPVYSLGGFDAIKKVGFTAYLGSSLNETAAACQLICLPLATF